MQNILRKYGPWLLVDQVSWRNDLQFRRYIQIYALPVLIFAMSLYLKWLKVWSEYKKKSIYQKQNMAFPWNGKNSYFCLRDYILGICHLSVEVILHYMQIDLQKLKTFQKYCWRAYKLYKKECLTFQFAVKKICKENLICITT